MVLWSRMIASILHVIAGVFRWALYAIIGVVATCVLILVVLIGGNSLHLWGQQASHPVNVMQPAPAPK
jgi:hypothetical protein